MDSSKTAHQLSDDFPDLTRFMAPRAMAIVGATEDLSKFGGRCMRQAIDFGYEGAIYPVNPKRESIFGLSCYKNIGDLPSVPDHVGLILSAKAVPAALEECASKGVPFVTIFSSGFGEVGTSEGKELESRILSIARAANIRLMGPNCNGMVNFVDRFALTSTATIQGAHVPSGDIGVVSQSGGAGQVNVMWRAQQAGLGISYQVSCGNASDLDLVDYAAFMLKSQATRVVLMLVESISSGHRLGQLAELSHQVNKPIVMVKIGRTQAGSRAAASHTGAITGADDVCDAALRQMGIIRVDDCNELYETAMLLRQQKVCTGRRAAATSISGGNLVMVADLGSLQQIEWPEYSDTTCRQIEELLPGFGNPSNPTDLTAAAIGQAGAYVKAVEIILEDPGIDALIPVLTMAHSSEIMSVAELSANSPKPVAMLWTGGATDRPEFKASDLVRMGHAVYTDTHQCVKALARLMDYGDYRKGLANKVLRPRPPEIEMKKARELVSEAGHSLTETQAKKLLQFYGIPITREHLATTAEQAVALAKSINGAVALKIQSPQILHKTEVGGVRINLATAAEVSEAYAQILQSVQRHAPNASIDGVLVQEMVTDAVEFFVGVSKDPVFGPVLTIGFGGIYVEILQDVVFRIPVLDKEAVATALQQLRGYGLLLGARGGAPRDINALIDTIVKISWLAVDLADLIDEIDINPIGVLPDGQGVRVIDSLIVRPGK